MSAPPSSRPASRDKARWKLALFHTLDGSRTSGPSAVAAPAPAPAVVPAHAVVPAATAGTPSPAMSFEAWAVLSLRRVGRSDEQKLQALRDQSLTLEAWARIDAEHMRTLSDDLRAARTERPALYAAKQKEELARRAGALHPPEPERVLRAARPRARHRRARPASTATAKQAATSTAHAAAPRAELGRRFGRSRHPGASSPENPRRKPRHDTPSASRPPPR